MSSEPIKIREALKLPYYWVRLADSALLSSLTLRTDSLLGSGVYMAWASLVCMLALSTRGGMLGLGIFWFLGALFVAPGHYSRRGMTVEGMRSISKFRASMVLISPLAFHSLTVTICWGLLYLSFLLVAVPTMEEAYEMMGGYSGTD